MEDDEKKDCIDLNPGRIPPTERVPMVRIGERPSDTRIRGDMLLSLRANGRGLTEGVAECTCAAVASLKCHTCLTTEINGISRGVCQIITAAVAQVFLVKNSYCRKTTSKEKFIGRWSSPVSSDRSIYKKKKNFEL